MSKEELLLFKAFYSQHVNKLLNYAMGFLKSREETEEAVQDIFIKFWNNKEKIKDNEAREAYLFNIAHNHLLNCLRKKAKVFQKSIPLEDLKLQVSDNIDLESELILDEQMQQVKMIIKSLSPEKQLIFELKQFKSMTNKQIAEQLSISTSMVEKHWRQINQAIKSELGLSNLG